jgi:methionine aminotransferase
VIIELEFPDYAIDWQKVREKVNSKTRMIVLNTPHNPTAAILREEDIQELRSIVADTEIFILSDEVYEHLIYDGRAHLSILRYPDLLERSFVCFSFGKVYHCTGWKLGYCVSSPEFMNEFRRVHQYNCFSCHTPSQVGLSQFLRIKESYLGLSSFMQSKRDLFRNLMSESRFEPLPSYGSYFQLYKYDAISDESDIEFAKRITLEYGVASIPLSAFYHSGKDDHVLRFCFAKKDETLERAVLKLKTI